MRSRFFRMVVLPLVSALVVSMAVYSYLSSMERRGRSRNLVGVVVAGRAVSPGTTLSNQMLAMKELPEEFVDPLFVTSLEDAVGRVTTVPLAEGEILYRGKLASADKKNTLADHVPDGMRAIAIPVNETAGVAGLIEPGDRVDVICTLPAEVASEGRARLIAEDVPVLAVVQSMQVKETPGRDLDSYTSLTVCVTPEQAVLIAFAEENGSLKLALRGPDDASRKGEYEVTADRFGG